MTKQATTSEQPKKQDSGILKPLAALIIIILAIAIGYYILTQAPPDVKYNEGEIVAAATFTAALQDVNKVFIIMDVRNITSEKQKGNILQCGTDFAGSAGLANKELIIYAIENETCTGLNTTNLKSADCLKEAVSNFAIFVNGKDKTKFMINRFIVGISETYEFGSCKVNVK